MSVSIECQRTLRNFGLTGYEVKAYLSLIQRGGLTAREVSRESQIPYSKVYDVLSSLEGKGWVQSEHTRPNKYFPKPPSEALEAARLKLHHNLEEGEKQVIQELQPLYERKEHHERPDLWIVRGPFNILARIQDVCERATSELQLAVPVLSDMLIQVFDSTLKESRRRGLKISMMTVKGAEENLVRRLLNYGSVRVREQMFGGGVIADVEEVILILGEEDQETAIGIWSNHAGLTRFAKNYFGYLWDEAEPVSLK